MTKKRSFCCCNRMEIAINTKVFREGVQGDVQKSAIFGEVRPKIIFFNFSVSMYNRVCKYHAFLRLFCVFYCEVTIKY